MSLNKLLDIIDTGVILLDQSRHVQYWNDWMEKYSQIDSQSSYHKSLNELFPTLDCPRLDASIEDAITLGMSAHMSSTLNRSPLPLIDPIQKQRIEQSINIQAVKLDGKRYCMLQIVNQSNNFRRETLLQQQINVETETQKALSREIENVVRANAAKSDFLTAMSHELKTPLNAVLGFAQLLAYKTSNPLNETQSENVKQIIKAGDHLLSLIEGVLDLARIESGNLDIQLSTVDVKALLNECTKLMSSQAKQQTCQLKCHCTDEVLVKAEPTRLKQVLLNLLSNAVKFNVPNGKVTVEYAKKGEYLHIDVIDTGIGIDKSMFGEVFLPFNRLSAADSSIEGTGIGLNLSKKLMEEMQGRIGFDSQVGQGSRFWIEIPLA
ncbi:MAG: PAS domain-containing sensor histidine kinase [Psychrosphaera sp.]|nr:PAS domain-containing sensor histidine kinase [Psychrosphaera sp.]